MLIRDSHSGAAMPESLNVISQLQHIICQQLATADASLQASYTTKASKERTAQKQQSGQKSDDPMCRRVDPAESD